MSNATAWSRVRAAYDRAMASGGGVAALTELVTITGLVCLHGPAHGAVAAGALAVARGRAVPALPGADPRGPARHAGPRGLEPAPLAARLQQHAGRPLRLHGLRVRRDLGERRLQLPVSARGLHQQRTGPTDGECVLVVFLLEGHRTPGHRVLHPEKEVQPDHVPARVPPLLHDHQLVAGGQVCPRWTGVLHRDGELDRAHRHVHLLRPVGAGACGAKVPVVEALPHHAAAHAIRHHRAAHELQPFHRLRLFRRLQHCGVPVHRQPHRPLPQLLRADVPQGKGQGSVTTCPCVAEITLIGSLKSH